jgi:predicted DNA-binding transcriptional regulator YafY
MRASRLVSLLLLLQTRGQMTAAALARELEVSVRSIHRDVEALSEAGVPIYAERGPHGGIRLVDGYRTRLTGMTPDEAEALFLSGLPGPAAELGLGTVVTAARLKVLAALPPELRARASRLVERFHLDAAGWFQVGEETPHLATMADAVWEARRVSIDYGRMDQIVTREIEPLGLVLKAGVWYVVALTDGQFRTYRVARIRGAEALDERFERPQGFDLAAYWAESSAAYEREAPRSEVTIRIRPERMGWLSDAVGKRAADQAERLEVFDPEGWVHLRLRVEWPDEGRPRDAPPRLRRRSARTAGRPRAGHGNRPPHPRPIWRGRGRGGDHGARWARLDQPADWTPTTPDRRGGRGWRGVGGCRAVQPLDVPADRLFFLKAVWPRRIELDPEQAVEAWLAGIEDAVDEDDRGAEHTRVQRTEPAC